MLHVLLKKELLEQRRTSKLLVTAAVFLVSGMISPLLARYIRELMQLIPDLPPEFLTIIPPPTQVDALAQYVKNTAQFGVLLFIIFGMSMVSGEKERGTVAMLLAKPVRRSNVILAKWLAVMVVMAAGLLLGGMAGAFYTALLFDPLPVGEFILLNALLGVYLAVFFTVALFASSIAKTGTIAAGGAFGGLGLLLILGAIPRLGEYLPGQLLNWGVGVVAGGGSPAWEALAASLGLIAALLLAACLYFEREEI